MNSLRINLTTVNKKKTLPELYIPNVYFALYGVFELTSKYTFYVTV